MLDVHKYTVFEAEMNIHALPVWVTQRGKDKRVFFPLYAFAPLHTVLYEVQVQVQAAVQDVVQDNCLIISIRCKKCR